MSSLAWFMIDWIFTLFIFFTTVTLVKIFLVMKKKTQVVGDMPVYKGYLPFIGHAHLALKFSYEGFVDEIVQTRKHNDGTLFIWLGPKLCGYIANPDDIETVLNRKDALNKGDLFNFFQSHSVGLLSNTIPRWNRMRKLANVPLAHKSMIEGFVDVYQQQSVILMNILLEKEGTHFFDIYPYLSRCCQDITYGSHFGVDLDIQNNPHLSAQESVSQSIGLIFDRMMKVWLFPDFIYFRTKRGKQLKKYVQHNNNIAKMIIEERKKILHTKITVTKENEFGKKMPILLDVYLDKESGLSEEEIKHEILDLMLAGFETMSLTQSWVLLLLAMFPEDQQKVQHELDQFLDSEDITLEQLHKCQYLDMVTKEALRLFGLPVVIRQLTTNVHSEKLTFPSDAEMIVAMCMVHRDPRYWEQPDKFHPDHFLPENEEKRPKYAYIPFGGGPRKCPAYAYGLVTVKFVVAVLLRKYTFTTKQQFENLPLELFFMYKPLDGYLVSFNRRSN